MDDNDDLIGALLSQVAGILENASVLAASACTARDPSTLARLEQDIADAANLMAATKIVQRR